MRRTPPQKESDVVHQMLLGTPYKKISEITGIPVSTIKKIKQRHKETFQHKTEEVIESYYERVNNLLKQSHRELGRVLANDRQASQLSVRELLLISKEMHRQTTTSSPEVGFPGNLQKLVGKYL